MSDLDQEIGRRLRKARKLCGYKSARAFAIEQKIPESTYSQHETGKRSLSPEIVLRYCECLQVDPGWLLSGREASKSVDDDSIAIAEVALNTSYRQKGYQHDSAPMMVTDNLITMDMDILRDVLNEALQKCDDLEISPNQLQTLVEYCIQNINAVVQRSSGYQTKEASA